MQVIKRDGRSEDISFDKILRRVKSIGNEANLTLNYTQFVMHVINQLHDNITTHQIDELAAEQCATLVTTHPDYGTLASHIVVSNMHKQTDAKFFDAMKQLNSFTNESGKHTSLLDSTVFSFMETHSDALNNMVVDKRDYLLDYFGLKTLERSYLMKVNGKLVERPQYMFLRVACGIHSLSQEGSIVDTLSEIKETYDLMSQKFYTHATPTLFNSGTPRPQMSSCYLIAMEDDSIDGIFNTLKDCALISKWAGGIGLHVHNVRSEGSHIRGTNGISNGLVPMLRVFNSTARYVDQGGGKRNGSFAVYLEPWHPDILDFLELRKNHGDEETKARDLFYALWVPDLFMKRVKENGSWSLFCPDQCPGLAEVYGAEFEALYTKYESEGKSRKTMEARKLFFEVLESQMETGTPYLLYKDAANAKSNQKNLGTIKSSNLCTEIIEYSDKDETAVCNLASLSLSSFVRDDKTFDYEKLVDVSRVVTRNLNKVIDVNFYPTEKTKTSNMRHRPIGIGVQGLADVFARMNLPFHSDSARQINRDIFESIYYGAVCESVELAKKHGAYESYEGSPASEGKLQFDLWNVKPGNIRYDWASLKRRMKKYGLRNSLLLAPMPTASTAQILGNNEAFEPFTNNIYKRRTNAGEFLIVNKYLMKDLLDIGLWSKELKDNIVENGGSIQHIVGIPEHIKNKFKTVWEIPMRHVIDMAADRGAFICQSQSMNLWVEDPTFPIMTSMHFHSWQSGLKTGMYYLRRKPKHQPQQFTIIPKNNKNGESGDDEDEEGCVMCSG
jgi:ribonucleoside-diphosphate reductase alpha chain